MSELPLKDCPFCGNKALLEDCNDHHGDWFNLGCSDDKCIGWHLFYCIEIQDKLRAISEWNTRVDTKGKE